MSNSPQAQTNLKLPLLINGSDSYFEMPWPDADIWPALSREESLSFGRPFTTFVLLCTTKL
jgi:hypothetical protein